MYLSNVEGGGGRRRGTGGACVHGIVAGVRGLVRGIRRPPPLPPPELRYANWAERQVKFAHMIRSLCIVSHILLGIVTTPVPVPVCLRYN